MSAMEYVDVQERYSEKDTLPNNFGYFDLVNYCIHKDSPYTRNDFNSWKAMDAYKYFESGWIQSIGCKIIADGSIVIAEVKHSNRLKEKPNKCWTVINKDGVPLCGHCRCMAGAGEVCSHIAAVFFLMEAWGRESSEIGNPESISCTDILSKWLVPPSKTAEMAKIIDIKWSSDISLSPSSRNSYPAILEPFHHSVIF
ncbi:hypothetical protein Bhyg_01301 [Pseudolycoriella hygida]|uniref:SWIM-type domain-containing protein n=1 Tax=Pseudolycoriella hygida TaxID=35572 RepID=A0A9Q0N916_9DIPT|nr:hypothetical protein Bhyg_01301 [Pseudolycoriella hygida]